MSNLPHRQTGAVLVPLFPSHATTVTLHLIIVPWLMPAWARAQDLGNLSLFSTSYGFALKWRHYSSIPVKPGKELFNHGMWRQFAKMRPTETESVCGVAKMNKRE